MHAVKLRRGGERRVAMGHLWVFSNEIEDFDSGIPAGEDVAVFDAKGRLLGSGTFSPSSLIAIRLHARGREEPLDSGRIRERVRAAWECRQVWLDEDASACRALFSEADGLPGLVVDRYGDYLAVQCLTAGMDRRRDSILDTLEEVFEPRGIVLRNDSPTRSLEGLERFVAVARGEVPSRVEFEYLRLLLLADLLHGQKTGFFFDQRQNYNLLRGIAARGSVLDAFCYSGTWGLQALAFGARRVTFADISAQALGLAESNAAANGFRAVEFLQTDVLEALRRWAAEGTAFDVVVLDPPAFAKSRRHSAEAAKGYLNLNKWGMRCVRPGGYLITCSCSHHMPAQTLVETVALAAREAGREVRVLGTGRQAPDHPWIPAMPETAYLKVLLLQLL